MVLQTEDPLPLFYKAAPSYQEVYSRIPRLLSEFETVGWNYRDPYNDSINKAVDRLSVETYFELIDLTTHWLVSKKDDTSVLRQYPQNFEFPAELLPILQNATVYLTDENVFELESFSQDGSINYAVQRVLQRYGFSGQPGEFQTHDVPAIKSMVARGKSELLRRIYHELLINMEEGDAQITAPEEALKIESACQVAMTREQFIQFSRASNRIKDLAQRISRPSQLANQAPNFIHTPS